MEVYEFFISLIIILLSARIVEKIVAYFKLLFVIGDLSAEIVIGPSTPQVNKWVLSFAIHSVDHPIITKDLIEHTRHIKLTYTTVLLL